MQSRTKPFTKAIKYIIWALGIAWFCGFAGLYLKTYSSDLNWVLSIIYPASPAVIAIIANKRAGGSWKDLKFIRPSFKSASLAIFIPLLIIAFLSVIEIFVGYRAKPNWDLVRPVFFYIYNFSLMFIYVLAEEIGWRGYLQEKLINAFGALKGVTYLGVVWGLWHLPVIIFTGRNFPNYPIAEALIWFPISCIALSMVIAYFGFNRYSIYIGILVHFITNVQGYFIGPLMKVNYEEQIQFVVSIAIYLLIIAAFGASYQRKIRHSTKPSQG